MTDADYIQKAEELGYTVGMAFEGYETKDASVPTTYVITGSGLGVQVAAGDEEAWKGIVTPEAHELRVASEAVLHASDPENPPYDPDQLQQMNMAAAVALGEQTQEEADKVLAAWRESRASEKQPA